MSQTLAVLGGRPAIAAGRHVRWPVLGGDDRNAVMAVLERGVLSGPFAPEVRGLERAFASYVGSKYVIATNSGTSALHTAVVAAGVQPGDEVITPAFSFVASAMSILQAQAIPVFVDIEPRTLGIDPAKIEAAITPRTRAIMPVHIHGVPCDLGPVLDIAKKHNLIVIEDAAQSHGARYRDKQVGTYGAVGCFSLQSSKSLACGEGGLLVTDDEELFRRANRFRMFGEDVRVEDEKHFRIDRPLDGNRAYDSLGVGYMYRTSEMPAALARTQLKRLDEWNASALRNAQRLSAALGKLPGITPPQIPDDRVPAYHKYRVRIDPRPLSVDAPLSKVRDAMLKALQAEGVDAVLWQTRPVPGQTLFQKKEGFGRPAGIKDGPGLPWSLGRNVSYDLSQYPETQRLLDGSLCLFSHSYPIAPQSTELVDAYAEVFARVWTRLPEVLNAASTATSQSMSPSTTEAGAVR